MEANIRPSYCLNSKTKFPFILISTTLKERVRASLFILVTWGWNWFFYSAKWNTYITPLLLLLLFTAIYLTNFVSSPKSKENTSKISPKITCIGIPRRPTKRRTTIEVWMDGVMASPSSRPLPWSADTSVNWGYGGSANTIDGVLEESSRSSWPETLQTCEIWGLYLWNIFMPYFLFFGC